ncbi:S-adenosyl-L-methionine-dependent methyltransferase [Rhodocollybia butyracea]|uniref:S-adenosyl-L-methionine-dependent methyltransferase n=1 Tax=Rhodocollybia butyracea TaxID=206335 RepID=A0A9P5PN96_9AGAR|nr:S-adenosyl-L-methionine-dependent methyltransferase [Rhodocollybia butyracea]
MAVHSLAQQGFAEGTNEVYDRARPSYQSSVLAHIRQSIPTERSSPFNIVEIGAGTGIFTRALLAHPDWSSSIAEIRAVEPSAGMRAQFEKTVLQNANEIKSKISIKEGSFTDTGIEEGWADMIVIAQAYHWADPAYDAASVEFGRILKPSGIVVYLWNLEDPDAAAWAGSPQYRLELWRATFDATKSPRYPTLFEQPSEDVFEWTIPTTVDAIVERVRSKSYIAVMEREKKEEFEKLIGEADKKWIDQDAGLFEYPYKTRVIVARRK